MNRIAVTIVLLASGSTATTADPPHYDISRLCNALAAGRDTLARMTHQACEEGERSAYHDLTARWRSFPETARRACEQAESDMSRGSYAGLKECIDGELIDTQWRKNHPGQNPE